MKVRSTVELQDYVYSQLGWRKQELTTHRFLLQQVGDRKHHRSLMLRTGVCLIYAHWEGLAKNVSIAYLDYVGRMGLRVGDLSNNLIAACLRNRIQEVGLSKRPLAHTGLVTMLRGELGDEVAFSGEDLVDTRWNLNSDALRNLSCLLGIDYSAFEGNGALLDEKLLRHRNSIAHGQSLEVDEADYELLHSAIIAMMSEFGDRVVNAAELRSYRSVSGA